MLYGITMIHLHDEGFFVTIAENGQKNRAEIPGEKKILTRLLEELEYHMDKRRPKPAVAIMDKLTSFPGPKKFKKSFPA